MRSWKKPTPEQVERAVAMLVHAEHHRYFFDRLQNPEWIGPLWEKGFFRNPPTPEYDDRESAVRFPPWPESKYLARMAGRGHKYAKLVLAIILEMEETGNSYVHADLVDAALAMPVHLAVQVVRKAKRWAENPYWLLPEKLAELITHLARGSKVEEALELAGVLFDVLPGRRTILHTEDTDDFLDLPPEPRARFDLWEYTESLRKCLPDLAKASGLKTLQLLCNLLEKAICFSLSRDEVDGAEDYSHIWRRGVEDHPQNIEHRVKDVLVSAVRDAADILVREGYIPIQQVVGLFNKRRYRIFHRISLYIARRFLDRAPDLAASLLTDREYFDDYRVRHEYVLLLREGFGRLYTRQQQIVLSWIETGPDLEERRQLIKEKTGKEPTDDELGRYRWRWQLERLAWIKEFLPEQWRKRYRELVSEYGEPEHPDFPVYVESWVGPTSPKTEAELGEMSVEEIVRFLRSWVPPEEGFGEPSPEGLGTALSSAVREDPERFASEASRFKGLDPIYMRALLWGLREGLEQGKPFEWHLVLDLCQWIVNESQCIRQDNGRSRNADRSWGWARKEIARLLSAGLEDRAGSIPPDLREVVWQILEPLTSDPDPTAEEECGEGSLDPLTNSINTTRGEAMHAVVRYALWVRRYLEREGAEDRGGGGFGEMPEVRAVLDEHLDSSKDPSLTIRAVYGQWFPWLVLLDPGWATNRVEDIFPLADSQQAFFEAAWTAYIFSCRPYDNVFDILRKQYARAVERIGLRKGESTLPTDLDEHLAQHLVTFYWRGKFQLDDPLLQQFWERASDRLRAHALEAIGSALQRTPGDVEPKILKRLVRLWEVRLGVAKEAPEEHRKEIAAFGWWFISGKFDDAWSLRQLAKALKLSGTADLHHLVIRRLSSLVEPFPAQTLECVKYFVEGDREGFRIHAGRKHIRHMLTLALRNPKTEQEARDLLNYLGSRGFLDFHNLFAD